MKCNAALITDGIFCVILDKEIAPSDTVRLSIRNNQSEDLLEMVFEGSGIASNPRNLWLLEVVSDINFDKGVYEIEVTSDVVTIQSGEVYNLQTVLLLSALDLLTKKCGVCSENLALNKLLLIDFKWNMLDLALKNGKIYDLLLYLPELLRTLNMSSNKSADCTTNCSTCK
jgi:hypothetical protein